ncbi:AraC family transcriptional regulator, regulatory protein of adaptative response / methylated-DNA-[protein]-cysteine methyltransferase [Devosia enhydra]|uniref:methylated-DNA--[protein]-cysteine S-methyltransferase n=1 Tax=Devosia enhydra TaxID=665118 RepID=A0A1K2HYU8_9HYPH|nr:bifunctional helix-turn-helix domain-containing protein/methylated-DNA--[protein]-cysteine S-methyltransferase [Devosia enhydra]SFZ85023.1 AraC family transcriptional regulator, regulatory protein of adaptative response / methylated-DNA-[protein]-cysteine methyltransferase [Devosia enhydra]
MPHDQTLAAHHDYERVRRAIAYLTETGPEDLDLPMFAKALDLSERQLVALFQAWCGLTPKSFSQAVALDHARRLLGGEGSIIGVAYDVGYSSASRLHDLFVTHEAMPPGAWRDRGEGLAMDWGVAPSPFGLAVMVTTRWGLAGLGFADGPEDVEAAFADLARRWPRARYARNDAAVAALARRIFEPGRWQSDEPVRVVLIGTDFEVSVWQTLLGVPVGRATTYGALAQNLGRPTAARAVGAAVGRNPISFVVPCHRVVGATGALTGYHWGLPRKRAMLGWEAGVTAV